MSNTQENKAFIREMISSKKRLEDYPDRFDRKTFIMHEPAILPFGGTYVGLDDFQRFYPRVRSFYDFERFELLGVYGDEDVVFATMQAGLADSEGVIFIAEQFRFSGAILTEVRVHICDDEKAARLLRQGTA
jgi:hypothetical protein